MSKTIYIIEDDESIRELLKIALASFSYDVCAFDNAADALQAINAQVVGNGPLPDMILFDIMLPGMSGLDAVRLLKNDAKTAQIPVMMLTAKDTEMDTVIGLDCGADDYMTKPFGIMELGARMRTIFRRFETKQTPNTGVITFDDLRINHSTREVYKDQQKLALAFKEFELLNLLIAKRDRVVPRDELLSSVWGIDFVGESRTLDIHIRTLRHKLGDDAEHPKYIQTIRNVGYRFIGMENEKSNLY
jgi:two-component system alkaline phosphatase synthesis response regulator PhoP